MNARCPSRTSAAHAAFLGVVACLLAPTPCQAFAKANGSLVSSIEIVASGGALLFADPWTGEAFADADGAFDFDSGDAPSAFASSAYAEASASAASLVASASSAFDIPSDVAAFSFATGRGSLFNSFMVTGGSGDVEVTFTATLSGNVSVDTGPLGVFASTEAIFAMELDGDLLGIFQTSLLIGPSASDAASISDSISASRILQFDTLYFFYAEADSESSGLTTVPEPSTLLAGLVAIAIALARLRPRRGEA